MLVTDLPIWEECPFRRRVPREYEIRRGTTDTGDTVVIWDPHNQLHVDAPAYSVEDSKRRGRIVSAMVGNLRWAGGYKRSGGKFKPFD